MRDSGSRSGCQRKIINNVHMHSGNVDKYSIKVCSSLDEQVGKSRLDRTEKRTYIDLMGIRQYLRNGIASRLVVHSSFDRLRGRLPLLEQDHSLYSR